MGTGTPNPRQTELRQAPRERDAAEVKKGIAADQPPGPAPNDSAPNRYPTTFQDSGLDDSQGWAEKKTAYFREKGFNFQRYLALHHREFQSLLTPMEFTEIAPERLHPDEGAQRVFAAVVDDGGPWRHVLKVYSSIKEGQEETEECGDDSIRVSLVRIDERNADVEGEIRMTLVKRLPGAFLQIMERIRELRGMPPAAPTKGAPTRVSKRRQARRTKRAGTSAR